MRVERIERRRSPLQALADASVEINGAHDVREMLAAVCTHARAIIGAGQAVAGLAAGEGFAHDIVATSLGERYAPWAGFQERPDGSGIYRLVCEENRPMRLSQAELERHPAWRGFGDAAGRHPPMRGWLAAPLTARDGTNLGLVQLSDRDEGDFTADDEAILVQLAQIASVAIERLRREAELGRLAEQRRRLVVDALNAEDRARQRVAQALHDDVLQELLAAGQDVAEAVRSTGSTPPLARAAEGIARSVARLREAVGELHPVTLAHGGLAAAIAAAGARAARQGGFAVDISVAPDADGAHDRLALSIARELLANVAQHAGASRATVRVAREAGGLTIEVADDGRGLPAGRLEEALAEGHIGLASARERAAALGGGLEVGGGPAGGARVVARLPDRDPT